MWCSTGSKFRCSHLTIHLFWNVLIDFYLQEAFGSLRPAGRDWIWSTGHPSRSHPIREEDDSHELSHWWLGKNYLYMAPLVGWMDKSGDGRLIMEVVRHRLRQEWDA